MLARGEKRLSRKRWQMARDYTAALEPSQRAEASVGSNTARKSLQAARLDCAATFP